MNRSYKENILNLYQKEKQNITKKLDEFKNLKKESYKKEFMFCLLTPQSKAERCWDAILQIHQLKKIDEKSLTNVLKTRTRFHNNKAKYVLKGIQQWKIIEPALDKTPARELRNWLANNVKGYGLKEASHFLRNIGKSNNEIAILDRHILKNLLEFNAISSAKIKSKKHYLEIEQRYLEFAKKLNIPSDELDLLLWKKEHGVFFK